MKSKPIRIDDSGHPTRAMSATALLTASALAGIPAAAQAQQQPEEQAPHTIEAYVSEDAVQALYTREAEVPVFGQTDLRGGFFFNEERNIIGIAEMLTEVGGESRDPRSRWQARVGPRVYGALLADDNDAFSVGFGGEVRYFLTFDRDTSVSMSAYYAPDIVTFGETDGVRDLSLNVRTALNDETDIFFGWRSFELDLPSDFEVDDGMHFGVQARF